MASLILARQSSPGHRNGSRRSPLRPVRVQILQIAVPSPARSPSPPCLRPAERRAEPPGNHEGHRRCPAHRQEDRIGDGLPERAGRLTTAQGAALRASGHHFRKRPCTLQRTAPSPGPGGDLLWVCGHHTPTTTRPAYRPIGRRNRTGNMRRITLRLRRQKESTAW